MTARTLKIICAISLLLNLFLAVGIGTASLWLKFPPAVISAGTIKIAGAELPREERRAFRKTLHAARHEMRLQILNNRAAHHNAAGLLRAPVVDQPALLAALQRVRAGEVAVRAHLEEQAVPFVSTLSQADRNKLADGLEPKGPPPEK